MEAFSNIGELLGLQLYVPSIHFFYRKTSGCFWISVGALEASVQLHYKIFGSLNPKSEKATVP